MRAPDRQELRETLLLAPVTRFLSPAGVIGPSPRGRGQRDTWAQTARNNPHASMSGMDKRAMSQIILEAKKRKGMTWANLSEVVGLGEVWIASCAHGENCMTPDAAAKLATALELGPDVQAALSEPPLKGWTMDKPVPTDPLIYRFYEIVAIYGTTIKDVIEEKFGYGIMSAIDFKMDIKKEENPKGDRVVVTLNGKFLPYTKW
jgi:cyanate lyase